MAKLKALSGGLGALATRIDRARALFVGTDLDGTLAPIVARPGRARLPARARAALGALARLPGVRVAVLSGRALDHVRARIRLRVVMLAGTAGLETLDRAGRRRVHLPRAKRLPARLSAVLEAWCAGFPGARLEDKSLSMALHYRAVPARRQRAFVAGARRVLAPFRERVEIVHGKKVLEVMPAGVADKADAYLRFMPRGARVVTIYLGDDTNDEPVHAMLRTRGGFTVAVGCRRSAAEYAVRSPRDTVAFLEWLAHAWRGRTRGARRS